MQSVEIFKHMRKFLHIRNAMKKIDIKFDIVDNKYSIYKGDQNMLHKKRRRISRIFIRFLATYLIIILIPVMTLGIFIYSHYFRYMKTTLEKNRYTALEQLRAVHTNLLMQCESISEQIYLSQTFRKFELEKYPERALNLIHELNVLKQTNGYVEEIAFHFTGDTYIYSSMGSNTVDMYFNEIHANPEVYHADGIRNIFSAKTPSFLPLHHLDGFRNSMDAVVLIYPIPLQSHSPYATALFYIPQKAYSEIFGIPKEGAENIYIADHGTILVQSDAFTVSPAVLEKMQEGEYTSRYLEEGSQKYLAIHTAGEFTSLDYYGLIDLNEVYAPLRNAQIIFLSLIFVVLLLCGLLMYVFSRMNYNPLHKITEALNALPSAAPTSSSGELNTLLQGIDYVYRQNRQLNLELAESKDAKRSVVLVNFIKGRYPTKESLKPLCESLGFRVDHPFYAVWLVNFFPSSRLSPIDEETEAIFNRSQKDLDIYSTELLTSNTLAVVSFFDTPQAAGQNLAYIQNQLADCEFEGAIGISSTFSDYANTSRAFLEASTALTHHTLEGKIQIIPFRDMKSHQDSLTDSYPYHMLEEYEKAVARYNLDRLSALTDELIAFARATSLPCFFTQCILKDMAEPLIRQSDHLDMDALHLYEIYYSVHTVSSPNGFESCARQLLQIAGEISQAQAAIQNPEVADLLPILQYINETCKSSNFSLYNVAEHFHMSPSQLSNAFRTELHISPSAYITDYKMRMAKYLLETTDLGIGEICSELGYHDSSSFIRKFRQHVGVTPAAWRKNS